MKLNLRMLGSFCVILLGLAVSQARAGEISVSAAASLREVMNTLSADYMKQHPGVHVACNYSAAGTLARQIENGAPADIFVSANLEWMDYLQEKKCVDPAGTTILACNQLVVASAFPLKLQAFKEIANLSQVAIGNPKSVPAGAYAWKAMTQSGLIPAITPKLVMAKDVREALRYAEQGEVQAALVYQTDAVLSKKAKIILPVPQELYGQVVYPVGLTLQGAKNPEALDFYKFLQTPAARKVLQEFGFEVL